MSAKASFTSPKVGLVFAVMLVVQSFLMKLSISSSVPLLHFWDELVVLLMVPGAVVLLLKIRDAGFRALFLKVLSVYALVLFVVTLSGESNFGQALYQLVLDLKYPIVMLFCVACYRKGESEAVLGRFLKVVLWLNVPIVLFQLLYPGAYNSVFVNGSHFGVFSFGGINFSRAVGLFWFTGVFALFCAASTAFFMTRATLDDERASSRFYACLALLMLLSTLSRGEIIGVAVGGALVWYVYFTRGFFKPLVMPLLAFLVFLLMIYFDSFFQGMFAEIWVSRPLEDLAPRAAFYQAAVEIANDYFPGGAGLGTFGGAAAVHYDSSLFYTYGISDGWYFQHGMYLTDTFWPKVLAESGFFGAGVALVFYTIPIWMGISCKKVELSICFSLCMAVFLFVNSLSSPIYGSVFSVLISSFLFGGVLLERLDRGCESD